MNFYEFRQNNSGGSWVVNDEVCRTLIIEAEDSVHAERFAETLGVYFDGVASGQDCGCCGDRWSSPEELIFPHRWGTFSLAEAIRESKKHGVRYAKTTWRFMDTHKPDPNRYDIIFPTPESYAKFLKNDDWLKEKGVRVRIYYKSGKIKSI